MVEKKVCDKRVIEQLQYCINTSELIRTTIDPNSGYGKFILVVDTTKEVCKRILSHCNLQSGVYTYCIGDVVVNDLLIKVLTADTVFIDVIMNLSDKDGDTIGGIEAIEIINLLSLFVGVLINFLAKEKIDYTEGIFNTTTNTTLEISKVT